MDRNVIVRQANIHDLPKLIHIFDSYREHFKQQKNPALIKKFLFDKFEHRESVIFIAEDQDDVVGIAQLYPIFSSLSLERVWLLNDFYITESYRNSGVGKRLLVAVKEFARLTMSKGIELSVEHTNTFAWEFYEKQGFVMDKEFRYYFCKL